MGRAVLSVSLGLLQQLLGLPTNVGIVEMRCSLSDRALGIGELILTGPDFPEVAAGQEPVRIRSEFRRDDDGGVHLQSWSLPEGGGST